LCDRLANSGCFAAGRVQAVYEAGMVRAFSTESPALRLIEFAKTHNQLCDLAGSAADPSVVAFQQRENQVAMQAAAAAATAAMMAPFNAFDVIARWRAKGLDCWVSGDRLVVPAGWLLNDQDRQILSDLSKVQQIKAALAAVVEI
jgi:hypothetical protein